MVKVRKALKVTLNSMDYINRPGRQGPQQSSLISEQTARATYRQAQQLIREYLRTSLSYRNCRWPEGTEEWDQACRGLWRPNVWQGGCFKRLQWLLERKTALERHREALLVKNPAITEEESSLAWEQLTQEIKDELVRLRRAQDELVKAEEVAEAADARWEAVDFAAGPSRR